MTKPSGIDIAEGICEVINSEINKSGQIQKGNVQIWHILHSCDDDIWQGVFEEVLSAERYRAVHPRALELLAHLKKYRTAYYPFTMTPYEGVVKKQRRPKSHSAKGLLWSWLFHLRDVYNAQHHIDLPNADSSKGALDPIPYTDLFEERK